MGCTLMACVVRTPGMGLLLLKCWKTGPRQQMPRGVWGAGFGCPAPYMYYCRVAENVDGDAVLRIYWHRGAASNAVFRACLAGLIRVATPGTGKGRLRKGTGKGRAGTASYTHLTLPTNLLVFFLAVLGPLTTKQIITTLTSH